MKAASSPVFFMIAISLLTLEGCGTDTTPGGTPDAALVAAPDASPGVLANCNSHCDNQGTATDCPPEVATEGVGQCKQVCGPLIQSLDQACTALANAFFVCSVSSDSWKCLEGGNLPVQVDDSCSAETDAYAACVASQ